MRHTPSSLVALATLALSACGGGGGDSLAPGQPPPSAGIEGSGVAVGAITGFGSIFVNGVEYSTNGATIRLDDQPGNESQLRVGQVVTVKGRINADGRTGSATEVNFGDEVEGPVRNLNTAAGTFVVLGQTVRVTGSTVFDNSLSPASIEGLAAVGLVVEVSGFRDANNVIAATRIERKVAGGTFELVGTLTNLDNVARTFRVGSQVVDFSQATIANGPLADNRLVEAKGTTNANGVLVATRVEMLSLTQGAANDLGEIEGIVTRFVSNSDFDVGGRRVSTDGTTQFVLNGLTLALNVKVEVEGRFNASGVLVARKVELKLDNSARMRAQIDSINAAANQFTAFGVTVTVNSSTSFEDKSSANLRTLRFADLRTGDFLEIRGIEGTQPGQITATLVERNNPENRAQLQGIARNVADPNLQVLGVSANVQAGAQFRDGNDAPITRAQFFAQANSRLVKLRGTVTGSVLSADSAELEN